MQTFISKYGLAAHLALLAVTPLFLSPFCGAPTVAICLLWLAAVGFVWLLMEPSRRNDERLHEARIRVRSEMIRDPLFWILIGLVAFAGMRALNGGIIRLYDPASHKWILDGPSSLNLPGCVDGEGLLPFALAVSFFVLLQGCRHALGKSARIALASQIAVLTGCAAIMMVILTQMGSPAVLAMAGCSGEAWTLTAASPRLVSSPGVAYGLGLMAAMIAAAGLFECNWNKLLLVFSFAVGGAATGLFYFSTPGELVLFSLLSVLLYVSSLIYLGLTKRLSAVLKYSVTILIGLLVPCLFAVCVVSPEMTAAHGEAAGRITEGLSVLFPEGFWERREALSASALEFWRESPWLGRGLGSFPHLLWLSGASARGLESAGTLNGWCHLLAERGLLGSVTLAIPILFMTFTFIHRLVVSFRRHVFVPLCVLGILTLAAMIAMGFVGCSILRADALLPASAFYALAASSFPFRRRPKPSEDADEK